MPESKVLTISGKNISVWIAIATIFIGSIVDSALTRDQVRRNQAQLDTYPLAVYATQQNAMAQDIEEIKTDVKDLAKAINEYILSH
jgi:hypothetical protein